MKAYLCVINASMEMECLLNESKETIKSSRPKCETTNDNDIYLQNVKKSHNEIVSDSEDLLSPEVRLQRVTSSENIFIELPVEHEGTDRSLDTLSDSDDSVIFCSDLEANYRSTNIEKPKDLITEISEILLSLSDDERFMECINYSNNKFISHNESGKRRSSVDIIFTYNVLNILYTKLRELKTYFELIQSENDKLVKKNQMAEAEHVAYQLQVETLQKIINDQKFDITSLNEKIKDERHKHEEEKKEIETELKSVRKKYQYIMSENEVSVMRYVKNESTLINLQKEKENLAKRFKVIETERDDLLKKIKQLTNQKDVISHTLNGKKIELAQSAREIERLKEELSCKDIISKSVEENLHRELNRCKELNSLLSAEVEEFKKNSFLNSACSTENVSSKAERPVTSDKCTETEFNNVNNSEPDSSGRILHYSLMSENNSLMLKIQKLENEKLDYEKNIMNLKQINETQNEKLINLQDKLTEMEILRSNLKQMQNTLASYQNEIDRLKETTEDLRQDMESCREREAELLNFTEKLTAKNVTLQSEYAILEAKKLSLETDRAPLEKYVRELEAKVTSLTENLKKEIMTRETDVKELSSQLAERTQNISEFKAKLEDQEAENQSLKHKYSITIRELTKEVQQYRKCKQFDPTECNSSSDSVCLESRTSSCTSLNEQQLPKLEPDRQTLIERIVKLQKINAKHQERIEFLEEHVTQLLTEVKKKNRVIQHYVIREQSGALSSDVIDQHKAELSKYGGIMASLYNSKCDDSSLSLELSLEINRKLQAVLEDTILKNITLKESMETLGKEIARLSTCNKSNEEN